MTHKVDLTDQDNPEWTEKDFARARPAHEVLPAAVQTAFKRPPGRPKIERPKVAVSIRMDPDVLDHFKSTGPGWQSRMNDVLAREISRR